MLDKTVKHELDSTLGWLDKINIDASKRYTTWSVSIGFVRKDMHGDTIITEGKQIGDCSISVRNRAIIV